jgi:hypothetical protein
VGRYSEAALRVRVLVGTSPRFYFLLAIMLIKVNVAAKFTAMNTFKYVSSW